MNAELHSTETENLAQSLAREMKKPELILENQDAIHYRAIALPPNWTMHETDLESKQAQPRRKTAKVTLTDTESFVAYVKRHGSLSDSTIWCEADFPKGKLAFTSILNDHGAEDHQQDWRDHTAIYAPEFSEEWRIWTRHSGPNNAMNQLEFALFIENNLKDLASVEGYPTGTQMLAMATGLEINQDSKFKSQVKLQSGGVRLEFIEDSDEATTKAMEVFSQFALGLQVFRNGQAYQVIARLRYRQVQGKLTFWYELIRPDVTLEDASRALIDQLREQTGNPFFYGKPF